MNEVGLKDQCFGVEVELTGITREQAAQALADYFGTVPRRDDDYYDSWYVRDGDGKEWRLNTKWEPDTTPPQIQGIV